jgi:hypothetical protein
MRLLETALIDFRQILAEALEERARFTPEKLKQNVSLISLLISRACALEVINKVSGDLGVRDLEDAYRQTLDLVGKTNASLLINLSIALNHFEEFPLGEIRELHKQFSDSAFADTILADLVVSRMAVMNLDRRIRQSVGALFKLPPGQTLLVEQNIIES